MLRAMRAVGWGNRQVPSAHADMYNDVVSTDGNFWKLKDRSSRDKKLLTVLNIVDAASDIAHAVADFRVRLATLGCCAEMSQSGSSSCTDQQGIL